MENKRLLGAKYEALAAYELEKAGYVILERNFTCRGGEIDLVAREGEILVFAEVKYRKSSRYGSPEEAVDSRKQRRIVRAAEVYLHRHGGDRGSTRCRFDVVCVEGMKVRIIRDAFWL